MTAVQRILGAAVRRFALRRGVTGSDPVFVFCRTSLRSLWIANRLGLGSRDTVSAQVRKLCLPFNEGLSPKVQAWMKGIPGNISRISRIGVPSLSLFSCRRANSALPAARVAQRKPAEVGSGCPGHCWRPMSLCSEFNSFDYVLSPFHCCA